jgi:hypothetical protein
MGISLNALAINVWLFSDALECGPTVRYLAELAGTFSIVVPRIASSFRSAFSSSTVQVHLPDEHVPDFRH